MAVISTLIEVLFAALVAVGAGMELGIGWGMVVGGALGLWLSWMAGGGADEHPPSP